MSTAKFCERMLPKLAYRILQSERSLLGGKRWRYIDNGADVLAIAHCDHYKLGAPITIDAWGTVISSALDDRLGVHAVLDILPAMGIVVDVLLTTDEERGASTARNWLKDGPAKNYRYAFSFDRAGADCVYYNPMPVDFVDAISQSWEIGLGSYSDVSELGNSFPAFNAGIGYYGQHTENCWCDYPSSVELVERYARFHDDYLGVRFSTMPTAKALRRWDHFPINF